MEDLIATFVGGVVTGAGILYGYWKSIPKKKKEAAFEELIKSMEDGEISVSEGMNAAKKLIF